FVVLAAATDGRQLKTPLLEPIVAPLGALSNMKVSVCGGTSGSLATLVIITVVPTFTVRSETGGNVGAVLAKIVSVALPLLMMPATLLTVTEYTPALTNCTLLRT